MPARTRTYRNDSGGPGTIHNSLTGITSQYTSEPSTGRCDDTVGQPRSENALSIDKRRLVQPARVNGIRGWYAGAKLTYANHPPSCNSFSPTVARVPGSYRDATSAIAQMDPGEPMVSLPNFAYELKDLPGMLKPAYQRSLQLVKQTKARTPRQVLRSAKSLRPYSEAWLNYKFGWEPLFSDLADIFDISRSLEKKIRMIQKNQFREYISRTTDLGNVSQRYSASQPYDAAYPGINGTIEGTRTTHMWVCSKWNFDPRRLSETLTQPPVQQFGTVLGLDFDVTTIWNAMPWSWLGDWFLNVGDLLSIHNNRHGIRFRSACIMEETKHTVTIRALGVPSLTAPQCVIERVSKQRRAFSPTLTKTGTNYMSLSQLTTLASLKVTRS